MGAMQIPAVHRPVTGHTPEPCPVVDVQEIRDIVSDYGPVLMVGIAIGAMLFAVAALACATAGV